MRFNWIISALVLLGFSLAETSFAASPTPDVQVQITYLEKEGARIVNEAKRIEGEADRLRSEARRLSAEHTRLLSVASALDAKWFNAKATGSEVQDYPGRDRSQRIIRGDADRISIDIKQLEKNADQLDVEADRLHQLSADVFELLRKLRDGAGNPGTQPRTSDLLDFQHYIRARARELSVRWNPA